MVLWWIYGRYGGFGTAIAIPASMLVALGFDPLFSCLVCLIANGVPTPFGSIGIPTVTLANLVDLENAQLAFTQTLQLAPFMLMCPFLIVMVTGKGFKALKGVTKTYFRFWIKLLDSSDDRFEICRFRIMCCGRKRLFIIMHNSFWVLR